MRRTFEILLGLVLSLASIVPATLIIAAGSSIVGPDELPTWARVFVIVACVGLAWFCLVTGWRLLTGRERPGGGLLHPWFLYVGAFFLTWHAFGRGLIYGQEYARPYHEEAGDILALARSRHRKNRTPRNRK